VTPEQLIGKFARLRMELIEARGRRVESSHLERLMDELADTRRLIAGLRGVDEQTGDSVFVLNW
jgi:hypothetical protein